VGERYPNKWVCGYIYSDYLFPPSKGVPNLEDNLCLVVAPSLSYGYGLYRDKDRLDWQYTLKTWSRESENIAYYDLPTIFQADNGAPNPPGVEILSYIYPRLDLYGVKGVYIYGVSAWGHGAITNYLLAKLNWNPIANVDEVVKDFFDHAYGSEAGPLMQDIYQLLDSSTRRYHRAHPEARHQLTPEILSAIYIPLLQKVERLYKKAAASSLTTTEKIRLKAFEDNMALFYDYLNKIGLKNINRDSPFSRPEEEIKKLKVDPKKSILVPKKRELKLNHSINNRKYRAFQVNTPQKRNIPYKPFLLRGSSRSIMYSENSVTVPVNISLVRSFGEIPEYQILDGNGDVLAIGNVDQKTIIELELSPGQIYHLDVIANSAAYKISAPSAAIALSSDIQNRGLHLQKTLPTLYFYVPDSVAEFSITISADGPGEAAAAYLLSPDGRRVATLDTEGRNADRVEVSEAGDRSGFWALQWKTPNVGSIDDVWVKLGDSLAPWFYLYPSAVAFESEGVVISD